MISVLVCPFYSKLSYSQGNAPAFLLNMFLSDEIAFIIMVKNYKIKEVCFQFS